MTSLTLKVEVETEVEDWIVEKVEAERLKFNVEIEVEEWTVEKTLDLRFV